MKTHQYILNQIIRFLSDNLRYKMFLVTSIVGFSVCAQTFSEIPKASKMENSAHTAASVQTSEPELVPLNPSVFIEKRIQSRIELMAKGPGSYGGGMVDAEKIRVIVDLFKDKINEIKSGLRQYVKVVGSYPIVPNRPENVEREVSLIQTLYAQGIVNDIEEGIFVLRPKCFDSLGRERDSSSMIVKRTSENWKILRSPPICINLRSLGLKIVGKHGLDLDKNEETKTEFVKSIGDSYNSNYIKIPGPTKDLGSYHQLAGLLIHEHSRHFEVNEVDEDLDIQVLAEFVAKTYFKALSSGYYGTEWSQVKKLELFDLPNYKSFKTLGSHMKINDKRVENDWSSKDPNVLYGPINQILPQPLTARISSSEGDCIGATVSVEIDKSTSKFSHVPVQQGADIPLPQTVDFNSLNMHGQIKLTAARDNRYLGRNDVFYMYLNDRVGLLSRNPEFGDNGKTRRNYFSLGQNVEGDLVRKGGIYKWEITGSLWYKTLNHPKIKYEYLGEIRNCKVGIDLNFKDGVKFKSISLNAVQVPGDWDSNRLYPEFSSFMSDADKMVVFGEVDENIFGTYSVEAKIFN